MNKVAIKFSISLILMITFLVMAVTSKNGVDSKLYSSVSILIGAYLSHSLSTKNFGNG